MATKRYEGRDIEVTYELKRCIHASECVHGLPAVFDRDGRPWVQPDAADAQQLAQVIERCPTGALRYVRKDGQAETAAAVNTVCPTPDGPLHARGAITLRDGTGAVLATELRAALCRCGGSANKPYCDDSHYNLGFSDPGAVAAPAAGESSAAAGPLQITVSTNGPLRLEGPVRVEARGGAAYQVIKVALCRCGGSANKPYCDGSHKRIGFVG
jgi:CDGSH-type Zn-finger protein/uncharacterized Fe-S cluster protein YjdI